MPTARPALLCSYSVQEIPALLLPLIIRYRFADPTVAFNRVNTLLLFLFVLHYANRYAHARAHKRTKSKRAPWLPVPGSLPSNPRAPLAPSPALPSSQPHPAPRRATDPHAAPRH